MNPANPAIALVEAPSAPKAIGPYSHAARIGGLLYCSGQIEAMGEHKPARSTVQVAGLPLGSLIEIEVIAVV